MKWKFEDEFRRDKPETLGETDSHFDLDNYKDWLEEKLSWKDVNEFTPPIGIVLLAKAPTGIIYVTFWDTDSDNFSCQNRKEYSEGWQWKLI
jgi:hypothetical protein